MSNKKTNEEKAVAGEATATTEDLKGVIKKRELGGPVVSSSRIFSGKVNQEDFDEFIKWMKKNFELVREH